MRTDVNPVVAIGSVVAVLAVIGLLVFFRANPGPQAGMDQRNQQVINQMRQVGATATTPTTGTAPPQAMQMMQQSGGMGAPGAQPGYMQPGR